jgi:hypothetical protein
MTHNTIQARKLMKNLSRYNGGSGEWKLYASRDTLQWRN